MDERTEQFWKTFETETGEKVEARAMGAWFERGGDKQGLWGLLVLTDRSLRFKYMPNENWMMSLFRMGNREDPSARRVEIIVPRENLVALTEPGRGLFARIFGSAFHDFQVSWRDEQGERTGSFQADPGSGFMSRLRVVAGADLRSETGTHSAG